MFIFEIVQPPKRIVNAINAKSMVLVEKLLHTLHLLIILFL